MPQTKPTFSDFGRSFQEKLVQIVLLERPFADQLGEVLDVGFIEYKHLQIFTRLIYDYKTKYAAHPTVETMATMVRSELTCSDTLKKQIRAFFATHFGAEGDLEQNIRDADFVKDRALDFCRKQTLKEALIKSIDLMQKSSFDDVSTVINDALKLGMDVDYGYDYMADFEERYKVQHRHPISTGWPLIDNITKGGLGIGELGVIIAPTGCHAKGTQIMMHTGISKAVEHIMVGDLLMGPDGSARKVQKLVRGRQQMYRIVPTKGEAFVINGGHILSLVRTNDGTSKANQVINISVKDYLDKSKHFKHIHKLYRCAIPKFATEQSVVEPYFVGAMLGDGSFKKELGFTTADENTLNEVRSAVDRFDVDMVQRAKYHYCFRMRSKKKWSGKSLVKEFFEDLGLLGTTCKDKFIPYRYTVASWNDRLEILAGLLDTDGHHHHGGYDFISKSYALAHDVAFIARSLGLAAYVKEVWKSATNGKSKEKKKYYRVSISGDCSTIPCRLKRKQAPPRRQIKDVLRTGFTVKPSDVEDYYGFTVSDDHLYLMSDFTATHNCGKSMALCHLGAEAVKVGQTVIHYTLELADTLVSLRYDSCITGVPINDLPIFKEKVFDQIKDIKGKLIVKEYPTKTATTITIRNHLDRLKMRGIEPDLILVDYGDLLKFSSRHQEKRDGLESIYEELRSLAQEYKVPVWTASQTNRTGLNADVITMDAISEAFSKCFVADFIFSLSRTIEDKETNQGRIFIAKSRLGVDGIVFPIFMNTSNVKIKVLQTADKDEEGGVAGIDKGTAKLKDLYMRHRKEMKAKNGADKN